MDWLKLASCTRVALVALPWLTAQTKDEKHREWRKLRCRMRRTLWTPSAIRERRSAEKTLPTTYSATDLDQVLSRPWIYRVWTFQELVLAHDLNIRCGDKNLSWDEFIGALDYIKHPKYERPYALFEADWRKSLAEASHSPRPFRQTRHFAAWYAAYLTWFNAGRKGVRDQWTGRLSMKQMLEPFMQCYTSTLVNAEFRRVAMLVLGVLLGASWLLASFAFNATLPGLAESSTFDYWFMLFICVCLSGIFFLVAFATSQVVLSQLPWQSFVGPHLLGDASGQEARHGETAEATGGDLFASVTHAMLEREATQAEDRAIAVRGVFQSLGIALSDLDHTASKVRIYQDLFVSLLRWQEARVFGFLLNPGVFGLAKQPSWVPDWSSGQARVPNWMPGYADHTAAGHSEAAVQGTGHAQLLVGGSLPCTVEFSSGPFAEIAAPSTQLIATAGGAADETSVDAHKRRLGAAAAMVCEWVSRAAYTSTISRAYDSLPHALFGAWTATARTPGQGGGVVDAVDAVDADLDDDAAAQFDQFYQLLRSCLRQASSEQEGIQRAAELLIEGLCRTELLDYFVGHCNALAGTRGLFITGDGLFGTGPPTVRAGDRVALVAGLPVPMVLRQDESSEPPEGHSIVGPSFVHGMMAGERWREDLRNETLVLV